VNKVIYISWIPITARIARDWNFDCLVDAKLPVEYWNASVLLFGCGGSKSSERPNSHTLSNYQELESLLCMPENKKAIYMVLASCGPRTARLYRILSKCSCRMFYITWNTIPPVQKTNILKRAFSQSGSFLVSVYGRMLISSYKMLGLIKKYEVVFAAGKILEASDYYAQKVVPINMIDYDHVLRERMNPTRPLVLGNYVVFLDQNLTAHPDLEFSGIRPLSKEAYFQAMEKYFKRIEDQYKTQVVIASHPTANGDDASYGGRKTFKDCTCNLIKYSECVITHYSNSISYAVIFNKPLVLVYTNEMIALHKARMVDYIFRLARALKTSAVNVDEVSVGALSTIPNPDVEAYRDYVYNYLTNTVSEHTETSDIFLKEIQQGFAIGF